MRERLTPEDKQSLEVQREPWVERAATGWSRSARPDTAIARGGVLHVMPAARANGRAPRLRWRSAPSRDRLA